GVPGPVKNSSVDLFDGVGGKISVQFAHVYGAYLKARLFFGQPRVVGIGRLFELTLTSNEKSGAIADLCDGRKRSQIPNRGRKNIFSGVEKWREIVNFVSPMSQISARWAGTNALLVHHQQEAIVGRYVEEKMLGNFFQLDFLAEMKHGHFARRRAGRGDPLNWNGFRWRWGRGILRGSSSAENGAKSYSGEERHEADAKSK